MVDNEEVTILPKTGSEKVGQESAVITPEKIESYLEYVRGRGCTNGTVMNYRRSLTKLYHWLPETKEIKKGTILAYQQALAKQFMPRTVNMLMAPINGLLEYLDVRALQVTTALAPTPGEIKPELSRSEYLRLLSAAKLKQNERLYLLIKLFATTGIAVQEVPNITVEAVQSGKVVTFPNRIRKELRIPHCVQQELLEYCRENGIVSGSIFLTRSGSPISRTAISTMIQQLSKDSRVDRNKCNPRCLQKLYDDTQDNIQANVAVMLQMTYDNLLEKEQTLYGWKDVQQHV